MDSINTNYLSFLMFRKQCAFYTTLQEVTFIIAFYGGKNANIIQEFNYFPGITER